MTTILANSYGGIRDTPLLLAIRGNDITKTVELLINDLNIPTHQLGRFLWKEFEYLKGSPLYAAIISEQWKSWNSSFVDVLIEKNICYGTRFPLLFRLCGIMELHSVSEDTRSGVDGRCLLVVSRYITKMKNKLW